MGPTVHLVDSARAFFVKLHFVLETLNYPNKVLAAKPTTAVRCHFCQRPCQVSSYYQLEAKGQLKGWRCNHHAHPVEYIAIPDATYYAFMFTVWQDQHEYSVEGYKLPQGEQWELREGSSLILHFDYIPNNLTPDNIDGRLKTLIVFS